MRRTRIARAGVTLSIALLARPAGALAERTLVQRDDLAAAQAWIAGQEPGPVDELAPALFELLVTAGLSPADGERVRDVLAELSRDGLRVLLSGLVDEPAASPAERAEGLRVLAHVAGPHDLRFGVRLAGKAPGEVQDPGLRDLLQELFERELELRSEPREGFIDLYSELDPALAVAAVRAAASADIDDQLPLLASLLGRQPQVDAFALYHMQKLAHMHRHASLDARLDARLREAVRAVLQSTDANAVSLAADLAGRFADTEAVPELIELLVHPAPAVRPHAADALRAITGLSLGASTDRWQRWHADEQDWYQQRSAGTLLALQSPEDAAVAEAILELGQHRLFRHELAEDLLGVLDRQSPDLRLMAAAALAQLGSERALPRLVRGLEDPSPLFRDACWRALMRLTGENHPADPFRWSAWTP